MYRTVIPLLFLCVAVQMIIDHDDDDDILTEAQIKECRNETNYNGDFNETTQEMKCFFACTMKKAGVMDEKDGSIKLDKMREVWSEADKSDKTDEEEMHEFIKNAAEPCAKAITDSSDQCEVAFGFMMCIVKEEHSTRHRRAVRDTRFSTIVRTITWMFFPNDN